MMIRGAKQFPTLMFGPAAGRSVPASVWAQRRPEVTLVVPPPIAELLRAPAKDWSTYEARYTRREMHFPGLDRDNVLLVYAYHSCKDGMVMQALFDRLTWGMASTE